MESFIMHPEARNSQLNLVFFVQPLLSLPHCYHEYWKIRGLSKRDVFTRSPCSDRLLAGCLYYQVLYLTTHLVLKLLHKIGNMYPCFDRWRYSLNSQCLWGEKWYRNTWWSSSLCPPLYFLFHYNDFHKTRPLCQYPWCHQDYELK